MWQIGEQISDAANFAGHSRLSVGAGGRKCAGRQWSGARFAERNATILTIAGIVCGESVEGATWRDRVSRNFKLARRAAPGADTLKNAGSPKSQKTENAGIASE